MKILHITLIFLTCLLGYGCQSGSEYRWAPSPEGRVLNHHGYAIGVLLKPEEIKGIAFTDKIEAIDRTLFKITRTCTASETIDSVRLVLAFEVSAPSHYALIPSVNYNGNEWGRGREPKGFKHEDQWWTVSFRATPIAGATYSEGENYAVALWGEVDTQTGEYWFIHFQDKGAYGRIVHLQPVIWKDDWPVMGANDKDYCGEPVLTCKKPNVGQTYPIETPAESDEFNSPALGLQWQWHANPGQAWGFPSANGYVRLYGQYKPEDFINFWDIPNLLMQKLPAPEFTATVKINATLRNDGDEAGLIMMGWDYSYMAVSKQGNDYLLRQIACKNAENKTAENTVAEENLKNPNKKQRYNHRTLLDDLEIYFRITVKEDAVCSFSYSPDGKTFHPFGESFKARQGKWIGAKTGFFIMNTETGSERSWMDVDWFRVEKIF